MAFKSFFNNNAIGKTEDPTLITPLDRVYSENPIKENRFYKLLGVHLDETLSFKHHIELTCNKISKSLYFINKSKHFLTQKALRSLYYALIHPHLLYCTNIFSIAAPSVLKRITLLQKRAIRTITKSPFLAHTHQLFSSLKILPFHKIISFQKLMFMHSIEYQYCPPSFTNIWQKNHIRNIQLRNGNDFYIPSPKIEFFKRIPLYSLPLEWNNLPDELKFQFNRHTFKIALKNHLFEST